MKQANFVNITGGIYKGRKITTPGGKTHPMGERERLALFNMLTGEISGATVLDAFAGSGALGIEALSRGASSVTFVDKSTDATGVIRKNLNSLGAENIFCIISGRMSDVALKLGVFDVILADPPYDDFRMPEIDCLASVLKDGGVLVLSHPGDAPEMNGLVLEKTRQYARAHISFYHK